MTYKTFAAIDVGSYELAMKVYEISAKTESRRLIIYGIESSLARIRILWESSTMTAWTSCAVC